MQFDVMKLARVGWSEGKILGQRTVNFVFLKF